MSKKLDWTIKGFIIGALVDYALQILFRLTLRIILFSIQYWYIVFPLIAYFYVYNAVTYWWNNEAERDAIYASFQKDQVALINPRAVMTTGGIRFVQFDIVNGANARIYQVAATCTYEPEELRDEDYKVDRMYTEHAYAEHIRPGETERVKLPLVPNGYLWQAKTDQLVNLKCEPRFEHEQDDLFQGDMKKWRLSSQMEAQVSHEIEPVNNYNESVYLNVKGSLRNNSAETIRRVVILCETTSIFGFTDMHGKRFDGLSLKPGEVLPLAGRVARLSGKPTAAMCRLERVEKI